MAQGCVAVAGKHVRTFSALSRAWRACALLALLVLAVVPFAASGETVSEAEVTVTFARDIKPIFDKHCVDCHSGWFPQAGLRLDSLEGVREGGRSGPAIVPGSPEKGWIPHSLRLPEGRRGKMPPGEQRLSAEESRLIDAWIRQGAR